MVIRSTWDYPDDVNSFLEVLKTITPAPLYARIEFVRDDEGEFVVMELELIEPSLYLRMHPQAPARFAEAIDAWFG